jgi:MerR family Zn(II)-responsive transcriptional regulator of zntA
MVSDTSDLLKIGEFARRAGVSLRTLRYYEELGLISPSARTRGGFRYYRPEDLDRLKLIADLQKLGLTLEQIGELLAAPSPTVDRRGFLAKVRAALQEQERLVMRQIEVLQEQRRRVALGAAKLVECEGCDEVPTDENNHCQPCTLTSALLPESLRALF